MHWSSELVLNTLAASLRDSLDTARVTVRLRSLDGVGLVAEALGKGVQSMRSGPQEDATRFPTYEFLAQRRETLVQRDLVEHPVRPPASLIDYYGTHAQMLAPICSDGELVGVLSVHSLEVRDWQDADIAAAEVIARAIAALYASAPPP
jgi:GAF domain-containing protein